MEGTANTSAFAAGAEVAPFLSVAETKPAESAPFDTAAANVAAAEMAKANEITATLLDIEMTLSQAGLTKEALEAKLGKPLDQLTLSGAQALLTNLRSAISAKK